MFKDINRTAIWTIYVLIIIVAISAGYQVLLYATADARGTMKAERKVASSENRLFSYNHFFDLCATIQGYEASIDAQKSLLPNVEGGDKSRVQTNIAALEAQRIRAIAQYNVDASKTETLGRFKNNNLPDSLNPLNSTNCTYRGQ